MKLDLVVRLATFLAVLATAISTTYIAIRLRQMPLVGDFKTLSANQRESVLARMPISQVYDIIHTVDVSVNNSTLDVEVVNSPLEVKLEKETPKAPLFEEMQQPIPVEITNVLPIDVKVRNIPPIDVNVSNISPIDVRNKP
jgi:hypothetical protein